MAHKKLALLDYASELVGDVNLENTLIIASQHILESIRTMFGYLIDKGANPKDIYVIGKCYSSNSVVLNRFKKMGINISEKSMEFDSYVAFDEQFDILTMEFLKDVLKKVDLKKYKKVIILEDGGSLLSHANRVLNDFSNVVGVEQTSAGYEKLRNAKLKFPVINVARSKAKLVVESPIIAKTFLNKLEKSLKKINKNPKNALVIGSGAIGNAIYSQLKSNGLSVFRYDIEKNISDFKNESLENILSKFDLVVGCTGKKVIDLNLYKYLKKDSILASASSSDREFSAVDLRKLTKKTKNCHKDIFVNGIYLINGGFPVNFDGEEISSPLDKIQITLSLLFTAVCIATKKINKKGLIELGSRTQNKLTKKFNLCLLDI